MRNNFNYFYSNTLLGWNKIQILIYNLEEWQIEYLSNILYNYGNLCDTYISILKRNVYINPLNIKRYKEYFKYKKLINNIIEEFNDLYNIKLNEIQLKNDPPSPEHIVIKGFKSYDD